MTDKPHDYDWLWWPMVSTVFWMVIVGFFLAGCSGAHYETDLGIDVYVEPGAGFPGEEWVDRTWMLVAASLGDTGAPDEGLSITYTPTLDSCVGSETVGGCYDPSAGRITVQRTSDSKCRDDALAHEFIHDWEVRTARPYDHKGWWFVDVLPEIKETLEQICKW